MKTTIRHIARFAFQQLPVNWRYRLRRNRYSTFEASAHFLSVRQNLHRIQLTEQAFIDVFWKALPIGRGPAASVVIHDEEVLRFDCFGAGDGHFHASFLQPHPDSEIRLFFPEDTIPQQIDRSMFELTHNLYYYTQRSPYADVRKFRADKALVQHVSEQIRMKMNAYIQQSQHSLLS